LEKVTGMFVKLLKYDSYTNAYYLQQSVYTNFEGQGTFDVVLYSQFYKFVLEYPVGNTVLTTDGNYIISNDMTIQVNLNQDTATEYLRYKGIDTNLTFNNETNNFKLEYNDIEGTLYEACLYVYNFTNNKKILYNSSCINSATGTILINIPYNNYSKWIAESYLQLEIDSSATFDNRLYKSFIPEIDDTKNYLIYDFFITVTIMFICAFSIELLLIMLPLPTLIMSIVGFIRISPFVVIGIEIAFIILAYFLYKRRQ
jgi:hypothetical protein